MERNEILAAGRADFAIGNKANLRAVIWFAYGYHLAEQDGDKEAKEFFDDVVAIVKAEGFVKQSAYNRANPAKIVGKRFKALFGAELASVWESPAHMIQACFNAAQASGATTLQRLTDWAEHGEPGREARIKAEKEAEKAAEKAKKAQEAADRVASTQGGAIALGFDVVPVPVPVQKMDSAPVTVSQFDGMTDEALAQLIDAAKAEMARRIEAAAKAA